MNIKTHIVAQFLFFNPFRWLGSAYFFTDSKEFLTINLSSYKRFLYTDKCTRYIPSMFTHNRFHCVFT